MGSLSFVFALQSVLSAMPEKERVQEYHKRGYSKPTAWQPATVGWKQLLDKREAQLKAITELQPRWDGYTSLYQAGVVVKNYTRVGFEVVSTPPMLQDKLSSALLAGLAAGPFAEHLEDAKMIIPGPMPKWVAIGGLAHEALEILKPMHERWANVELEPVIAYG